MYKLFLTLRYLRKRRIAYFAIAAVTLCTAMVLIVMSVMGGFLDMLTTKARGMLGDVVIDNGASSGFPLYDEFIADIKQWPEIIEATPLIYSYGILRFPGSQRTDTVQVVGLHLDEVFQVNDFKRTLYYDTYYPGTTNLGEQQQPLLGIDPNLSPPGKTIRFVPILPEPYRDALAKSRAAGLVDHESPDTLLNDELRDMGGEPIPGIYAANPTPPHEPTMAGDLLPGLIIGRDLIARRKADGTYERFERYPRGCTFDLTYPTIDHAGNIDADTKRFRYVDDSRTGIYEIDSQQVYCDFNLLQHLLFMDRAERVDMETGDVIGTIPGRCSQIQIKLRDTVNGHPVDPLEVAHRLRDYYHNLGKHPPYPLSLFDQDLIDAISAKTWAQSQAHIIAPVEKERNLVTILFAIISLVAAFLVLCILYMIVLQKTRDIGIIKSIGGSSAGAAGIFLFYGAAVGIVGATVGTALGYWFVININEVQSFLTWLNPSWQVWDRSVYSFDEIPHTVRFADMATVFIAAIIASTSGSVLAAWRAGAMQPVEALRHE